MEKEYFNLNKINSYNADMNFIISKRSYGKSITTLIYITEQIIDNLIRDKEKFVVKDNNKYQFRKQMAIIRRTDVEIKNSAPNLLTEVVDIINQSGKYKTIKLTTFNTGANVFLGISGIHLPEIDRVKSGVYHIQIATFLSLKKSQGIKGMSLPYHKYLVFDEFMSEAKKWENNELEHFLSIYTTVRRSKKDFKCYLLGNTTSIASPYHIAFGVYDLTTPKVVYKDFKPFGKVAFFNVNGQYKDRAVLDTDPRFGSDYFTYANGEFLDNDISGIKQIDNDYNLLYNIMVNGKEFSIWRNDNTETFIVNYLTDRTKIPISIDNNYQIGDALRIESLKIRTFLNLFAYFLMNNQVYFVDPLIKQQFFKNIKVK